MLTLNVLNLAGYNRLILDCMKLSTLMVTETVTYFLVIPTTL